jgi:hypothetical protein
VWPPDGVLAGDVDVRDVVGALVGVPLGAVEAVLVAVTAGLSPARPSSSEPHAASTPAATRTDTVSARLGLFTAAALLSYDRCPPRPAGILGHARPPYRSSAAAVVGVMHRDRSLRAQVVNDLGVAVCQE